MTNSLRRYFWLILLGILLVTNILVWLRVFVETPRHELVVSFLDVGQGDAIFIQAPSGNKVLIDGGPDKKVLRQLNNLLSFTSRKIDLAIESHPDSDHIGGLPDVVMRYDVSTLLTSGAVGTSGDYKELEKEISDNTLREVRIKKDMIVDLGGGAKLEILSPVNNRKDLDSNTSSIVARLTYGQTAFMMTGDVTKSIEDYLAKTLGGRLKSDVYKVSHHGSRESSSEMFLGFIHPTYAVISVGADNKYGHPHKEVLELLSRFNVQTFRTDSLGAITFVSDGERVIKK